MTYFTSPSRANITKGNLLFKVSTWFELNRLNAVTKNKIEGLALLRVLLGCEVWFVKLVRKKLSKLSKPFKPSIELGGIHDEYKIANEVVL